MTRHLFKIPQNRQKTHLKIKHFDVISPWLVANEIDLGLVEVVRSCRLAVFDKMDAQSVTESIHPGQTSFTVFRCCPLPSRENDGILYPSSLSGYLTSKFHCPDEHRTSAVLFFYEKHTHSCCVVIVLPPG